MAAQSRIVSFDEARRNTRAIHGRNGSRSPRPAPPDKIADRQNLNNIFKLDFTESEPSVGAVSVSNVPRQALFGEEDLLEEDHGVAQGGKGAQGLAGLFGRLSEARKSKAKRNAERAFEKSYGGGTGAPEAGPRAALYTGKMGASQKKANRIQEGRSGFSLGGFSLPSFALPQMSKTFKRNVTAALCTVAAFLLAGSIYTPAQQYYQQVRERDRLSAEYAAVQERNEALQATVDRLSTDEGLEDKAHAEFGLVNPDEHTASVIGIEVDNSPDFHANVTPGSVPAPETWYSGILDPFFMYDRG